MKMYFGYFIIIFPIISHEEERNVGTNPKELRAGVGINSTERVI